jgi:hypothetical protein
LWSSGATGDVRDGGLELDDMEIILIDYDDNWFSMRPNNAIIRLQRLVEMVPRILTKQDFGRSGLAQPKVVGWFRLWLAAVGRTGTTLYGGIAR